MHNFIEKCIVSLFQESVKNAIFTKFITISYQVHIANWKFFISAWKIGPWTMHAKQLDEENLQEYMVVADSFEVTFQIFANLGWLILDMGQ